MSRERKAFVINLARRPDRLSDFIQRNESLWSTVDVQRVEAVDGRDIDLQPLRDKISPDDLSLPESQLRGVVACSLSHRRVLDIIAGMADRFAIVFEDDATMARPWVADRFNWICRSVPSDADLIWLGGRDIGIGPRRAWLYRALLSRYALVPRFARWEAEFLKTSEAYIVSPRFAATFCRLLDQNIGAIDASLWRYAQAHREAVFYRHVPPIFTQADKRDSDIRGHQFTPTAPLPFPG